MTPKRYVIYIGVFFALIAASYWYFTVSKKLAGPVVRSMDWEFVADPIVWEPLWDAYSIEVMLTPLTGRGQLTINNTAITKLCGAVLSKLPSPPSEDISRGDVFRVGISIPPDMFSSIEDGTQILENIYAEVTVINGVCSQFEENRMQLSYPAPIANWNFSNMNIKEVNEEVEYKVEFNWSGEGKVNVLEFPLEKACDALVKFPPKELIDYFNAASFKLTIEATDRTRLYFAWYSKSIKEDFIVLDRSCLIASDGDGA